MTALEIVAAMVGVSGFWEFIKYLMSLVTGRKGKIEELSKKIDGLSEKIDRMDRAQAEDNAIRARTRILRFNDELLNDTRHSKECFDQVLDDVTMYETYCNEHPNFKNSKAVHAIGNINKIYDKCQEEHDFL